MKPFLLALFLLCLAPLPTPAATIAPFTTDGCSRFPDGTAKQPQLWRQCCVEHDLAYWKGGSYHERLEADLALQSCVSDRGQDRISELMFLGVRMGGSPLWPTDYRWGYGWPYLRGYEPLTAEEQESIRRQLVDTELTKKK